jgi:hypothetical protein
MVLGTFLYPEHPYIVRPMLYLGSIYFVALAVVKGLRDRKYPPGIATEH